MIVPSTIGRAAVHLAPIAVNMLKSATDISQKAPNQTLGGQRSNLSLLSFSAHALTFVANLHQQALPESAPQKSKTQAQLESAADFSEPTQADTRPGPLKHSDQQKANQLQESINAGSPPGGMAASLKSMAGSALQTVAHEAAGIVRDVAIQAGKEFAKEAPHLLADALKVAIKR